MSAADSDMEDPNARRFMEEEPQAAVIADVATDPQFFSVLEEAVGRVNPIYVVVPVVEADGSSYLQVAKGGVFSYYEFPWSMDDRLTDEKWRAMLDAGEAPASPAWTASFLVDEIEYAELSRAIHYFHLSLVDAFWYRNTERVPGSGAGVAGVKAQIEAFTAAGTYVGHQLVDTQMRSFDLQSSTVAVVTTRETWQDSLYATGEYSPDFEDELLSQRGPYTLDATYTLELVKTDYGPQWQVTGVVYADQPPEFSE